MKTRNVIMFGLFAFQSMIGLAQNDSYATFDDYPVPAGSLRERTYSTQETTFQLWAPTAQRVELNLYATAKGGKTVKTVAM